MKWCVVVATCIAVSVGAAQPAALAYTDGTTLTAEDRLGRHLHKLQEFSATPGSRVVGTEGAFRTADYIEGFLLDAGYSVSRQRFAYDGFIVWSPSSLAEDTGTNPPAPFEHKLFHFSGSGDLRHPVTEPVGAKTGCQAEDYGPTNKNTIVLVERGGGCDFADKAKIADTSEAGRPAGLVIYNNEGAGPLGSAVMRTGVNPQMPVVWVEREIGTYLAGRANEGLMLRLKTDTSVREVTSETVIAESPFGDPDNVVMVGGYYDSRSLSPGINLNGSNTAAMLEVATQLQHTPTANRLRFVFFADSGDARLGKIGPDEYLKGLSEQDRLKIAAFLYVGSLGAKNYGRYVSDGDNSTFPPGPIGPGLNPIAKGLPGSAGVECALARGFAKAAATGPLHAAGGIFCKPSPDEVTFIEPAGWAPRYIPVRSTAEWFLKAGIPSSSVYDGGGNTKTEDDVAAFGGTAGVPYDACSGEPCDTVPNVDGTQLHLMFRALLSGVSQLAESTYEVNGGSGGNSGPPPLPPAP